VEENVIVDGDDFPACRNCCGERTWIPSRVNTDIWGSPTYIRSLDQEFGSRSELRTYLKANGLQEAGDKVNGARTFRSPDPPKGKGKAYRYAGDVTKLAKR
jgi:hypothetical protein